MSTLPGKPDPVVTRLVDVVQQSIQGEAVYLVGGVVRDLLLGRPSHDLDFVLGQNVRPLARRVAGALGGDFYMMDEERCTARVIYHSLEAGHIYLDFSVFNGINIEEDLSGRDFSVNAMALDLAEPEIILDPLGGKGDLAAKRLRAASAQALQNDPIRVLRGIRQALALQFEIDQPTMGLMTAAAGLLKTTSTERQRDELFKMLEGPRVADSIRLMDQFGVLDIVLPELAGLKGVTQSAPHIYTVWDHTLAVAAALEEVLPALAREQADSSASPWLKSARAELGRFQPQIASHYQATLNSNRSLSGLLFLAGLYHDIAKPVTRQEEADGRTHFIGHDLEGARVAFQRALALALSQVEAQRIETIISEHMRIHLLAKTPKAPSRRAIYRYFRSTGPAGVDICLLSLADTLATYGSDLPADVWQAEVDVCRSLLEAWWERPSEVVAPPRLVTGDDLIHSFGLQPGPKVGELLAAIREAQACGEINDQSQALEFARKFLKST